MALINFRKLLFGKTKKTKPSKRTKVAKSSKRTTHTKTPKRTKRTKTPKRTKRTKTLKRTKRHQKGAGGNYRLDVATGCKIGGLPVVSPINDCPKGVGPADPSFGSALYTHPVVGGGR